MTDKRLIDANALHKEISIWIESSNRASSYADAVEGWAYSEVLDAIKAAPTINPWHPASEVPALSHFVDDNGMDVYEYDGSEEMIVKADDGRNFRARYVIDNYCRCRELDCKIRLRDQR